MTGTLFGHEKTSWLFAQILRGWISLPGGGVVGSRADSEALIAYQTSRDSVGRACLLYEQAEHEGKDVTRRQSLLRQESDEVL